MSAREPARAPRPRSTPAAARTPVAVWAAAVLAVALVGFSRIELGVHWTTDVPSGTVTAVLRFSRPAPEGSRVAVTLRHGDELLADTSVGVSGRRAEVTLRLAVQENGQAYEELLWSPEQPRLIDAEVTLRPGGEQSRQCGQPHAGGFLAAQHPPGQPDCAQHLRPAPGDIQT